MATRIRGLLVAPLLAATLAAGGTVAQESDGAVERPAGPVDTAPAADVPAPARRTSGPSLGLPSWDSSQPLSIRSDELEAVQEAGRRRLVFTRNVRVEQGTLTMTSARLVAIYPEGASQPDRLEADGSVRLVQGERTARCQRATYDRRSERLTCQGEAEFVERDNRLSGDLIEIELATEKVRVRGGASVTIQPGPAAPGNDGATP